MWSAAAAVEAEDITRLWWSTYRGVDASITLPSRPRQPIAALGSPPPHPSGAAEARVVRKRRNPPLRAGSDRRCAGEDLNLHGPYGPQGPQLGARSHTAQNPRNQADFVQWRGA